MPTDDEQFSLLSNHAHVLVCLARDPDSRIRDVAAKVGITQRAVQRIVRQLEDWGVVTRVRTGRRNHYEIDGSVPLRHDLEGRCTIAELLDPLLARADARRLARGRPESSPDGR